MSVCCIFANSTFHNLRLSQKCGQVQNIVSSIEAVALMQGFKYIYIYGFIVLVQLTPHSQNITTIFGNSKRVSKFGHHEYILSIYAWLEKNSGN